AVRRQCKSKEKLKANWKGGKPSFTGVDHEKSVYTKMANDDAILRFKYLTHKKGCMGAYNLARDEEYSENLLVSEKVKIAFEREKVTGVWLVKPEEFYRPLSELL
ncbi:hypothetical protein, partial [Legionella sp. CNM-4043-24]|uniref:hypothetical protein n=1 Tax=Legionella sp. CNM-4043-24 TaxID=3421646 RepID=UPI00403ABC9C